MSPLPPGIFLIARLVRSSMELHLWDPVQRDAERLWREERHVLLCLLPEATPNSIAVPFFAADLAAAISLPFWRSANLLEIVPDTAEKLAVESLGFPLGRLGKMIRLLLNHPGVEGVCVRRIGPVPATPDMQKPQDLRPSGSHSD